MTALPWKSLRWLSFLAIICCASVIAGVIWSSGRGLELTDEAYYILSAIHPDQVQLYVSAQHWMLAPLWALTESLQGFRLIGATLLVSASTLLSLGAARCFAIYTGFAPTALTLLGVVAAGGIGALLYVVTIAPSPSYNLLASVGAYAAMGCALFALDRRQIGASFALCCLAGAGLAICVLNKPAAGICVGLTILVLILYLQSDWRKWIMVGAGGMGTISTLGLFVLIQPSQLTVFESLSGGLELFRMVQTEPILARLIRYVATVAIATSKALLLFLPVVIFTVVVMRNSRQWQAWGLLLTALCTIIIGKHYLGGMTRYTSIAEAIYALLIIGIALGFNTWIRGRKTRLLFAGLLVLPFSITIGTGNSLFTQVIVALAPWTIFAFLSCWMANKSEAVRLAQTGITAVLLILIPVQVFSSFTREPYHLNAPLTAQSEDVFIPRLGALKVDLTTAQFLIQMNGAQSNCAIRPEAFFVGLFNVPGLALLLDATPPVTPWLNNSAQATTILSYWRPNSKTQVIVALTSEAKKQPSTLPQDFQPSAVFSKFCGTVTFPFESKEVDIWLLRTP